MDKFTKDQDRGKGAVEDGENHGGNTSMHGQLGHRDQAPQPEGGRKERSEG